MVDAEISALVMARHIGAGSPADRSPMPPASASRSSSARLDLPRPHEHAYFASTIR
jgi:hypothetical protein